MRYALIAEFLVQNVIIADPAVIPIISGDWQYVIPSDTAQIGDTYNHTTGVFTSPPEPEPEAWPVIRTITVEKWYNRWTDEELGMFHTLAQTNEAVAGWEIWLRRQSAVSLDDSRITTRLQQGVTTGRITQERVDVLLADVQESEL